MDILRIILILALFSVTLAKANGYECGELCHGGAGGGNDTGIPEIITIGVPSLPVETTNITIPGIHVASGGGGNSNGDSGTNKEKNCKRSAADITQQCKDLYSGTWNTWCNMSMAFNVGLMVKIGGISVAYAAPVAAVSGASANDFLCSPLKDRAVKWCEIEGAKLASKC